MKNILKITLILVVLFSFVIVYAAPDDTTSNTDSNELIAKSFFIKQDENGNLIDNAIFKQTTMNGDILLNNITVIKDNQSNNITNPENNPLGLSGKYEYISSVEQSNIIYSMLTPDQKNIIDNLKTLEDYNRIKNNHLYSEHQNALCENNEIYINYLKKSKGIVIEEEHEDDNTAFKSNSKNNIMRLQAGDTSQTLSSIILMAFNYTLIDEIRTPKGLEKTSIIVPMISNIIYTVQDDNLVITGIEAMQLDYLMKYDSSIDYNDIADVVSKTTEDMFFYPSCNISHWYSQLCNISGNGEKSTPDIPSESSSNNNILNAFPEISSPDDECPSIVIDNSSTEDLSKKVKLESYVNGKKTINVYKGQEVNISVKVYNGSKTPLYSNRLVSMIPKGFTLVEGSIVNSGVYNSENNTVSWNIDYLDSLSDETFSYKIKAPNNYSEGTFLKTTSSLSINESDIPIISDEVQLDLGNKIENPKTGNIMVKILLLILTISIFTVVAVTGRNIINKI